MPVVRSVELTLENGAGTARVDVTPAAKGTNRLDIALLDASGQPIVPVDPPEVELTQPALDVGPLKPEVLLSPGPGEYQVVTDLAYDGDWDDHRACARQRLRERGRHRHADDLRLTGEV